MKFVYILWSIVLGVRTDDGMLCSEDICKDVTCDPVPEACNVNNGTVRGIYLPSPTTCNSCCDYCLEYKNEGEKCSVGNPSSPRVTAICGPGLSCVSSSEGDMDGICTRMSTDCTREQDDFDNRRKNGTFGSMELRPECDGDGFYASYKCIPGQSCYCVAKDGTRIFGEADFVGVPSFTMQCKCSRDHAEAVSIIGEELGPHQHFRCSSDGSYDTLQCIGDGCLCVDPFDGEPTYPDQPMVNITQISDGKLKCYNDSSSNTYYKKCEFEYFEVLKEVNRIKENDYDAIFGYDFPSCDLDGTYKPVQENSTHKMCVDKDGTVLTAIMKNDTMADNMNCKCLRAVSVMSTAEKPVCARNGNYEPIQCRRGTCRCVDSDGNQLCTKDPCEFDIYEKANMTCP